MANISFPSTARNMTVVDGYFAYVDYVKDTLFYKTDDGIIAFSYPLDNLIEGSVLVDNDMIRSLEYDGVNFWTLEQVDTSPGDMRVKRWKIDNYILKLQDQWFLEADASDTFVSDAFTVEHYHDAVVGGPYAVSSGTIYIDAGYGGRLDNGMEITIGPNSSGKIQTAGVDGYNTTTGEVTLADALLYEFTDSDPVSWYKNIWLFNNYNGTDNTTGALYKIDGYSPSATPTTPVNPAGILDTYPGAAYKDIDGCTFYNVDSFDGVTTSGSVDALCYVKASNLLFVDVVTLDYYGSMVLDNNNAVVYDLAMFDQNVYRLQGADYVLSTLDSLVSSIALSASPAIITANGVSTTLIEAYVKDQFFQPVPGRLVTFTESGDGTFLNDSLQPESPFTRNTDSNGRSYVTYQAGTSAATITITATVAQS